MHDVGSAIEDLLQPFQSLLEVALELIWRTHRHDLVVKTTSTPPKIKRRKLIKKIIKKKKKKERKLLTKTHNLDTKLLATVSNSIIKMS